MREDELTTVGPPQPTQAQQAVQQEVADHASYARVMSSEVRAGRGAGGESEGWAVRVPCECDAIMTTSALARSSTGRRRAGW